VATYELGDGVNVRHLVYDRDGQLADASVALTWIRPDATTVAGNVVRIGVGTYIGDTFPPDAVGDWRYRWDVTGAVVDVQVGRFSVTDPAAADPLVYYPLDLFKLGMSAGADSAVTLLLADALANASRGLETYCGSATNPRIFYKAAPAALVVDAGEALVAGNVSDELLVDDLAAAPSLVEVHMRGRGAGAVWREFTDYDVWPANAIGKGRPIRSLIADPGAFGTGRVRITAPPGWPDTPRDVREACKLLANRLYIRKNSPDATAGVGEWGPVRVAASDPDVRALLEPFRLESAG